MDYFLYKKIILVHQKLRLNAKLKLRPLDLLIQITNRHPKDIKNTITSYFLLFVARGLLFWLGSDFTIDFKLDA